MTLLDAKGITVKYGEMTVVNDVSFALKDGEWLMLVGPNGAGKSTIINAVSRGVEFKGQVLCGGKDIKLYKPAQLAQQIAVLTQAHSVGYSFTVGEVVRLGRYAYSKGILSPNSAEDENRVREALEITGLTALEKRSVLTLSGGELQRVFLAQVFAQNPRVLLLDEPTNNLDLQYQKQVFILIKEWLAGKERAVLSVVHDLSLAKAYGTKAMLLNKGKALACGKTEEVLSSKNLKEAYSIDVYSWMREMLGQWKED